MINVLIHRKKNENISRENGEKLWKSARTELDFWLGEIPFLTELAAASRRIAARSPVTI